MEFVRSNPKRKNINITPLIDLVFLLLVFFMLTSSFSADEGIDLFFSDSGKGVISDNNKPILVTVLGNGKFSINKLEMDGELMKEFIVDAVNRNPETEIKITTADKAVLQDLVLAIDEIKLAGGEKINITSP